MMQYLNAKFCLGFLPVKLIVFLCFSGRFDQIEALNNFLPIDVEELDFMHAQTKYLSGKFPEMFHSSPTFFSF